jgi:hypothetical protein
VAIKSFPFARTDVVAHTQVLELIHQHLIDGSEGITSIPARQYWSHSGKRPLRDKMTQMLSTDATRIATTMASFGRDLQQPSLVMRLPAEIRLIIYGFAIHDHLECHDFLTRYEHSELYLDALTKSRLENTSELMYGNAQVATQYLGVLALLHTSKIVYLESYHAIRATVHRHVVVQDLCKESIVEAIRQAKLSGEKELANYLSCTKSVMHDRWRVVVMVRSSVSNTWRSGRY